MLEIVISTFTGKETEPERLSDFVQSHTAIRWDLNPPPSPESNPRAWGLTIVLHCSHS